MGFLRPPLIQILNCRNLSITDLTIKNPPFWTINPVYCDGVTVRGVTIDNPDDSPNTDGINPESSRNVHISDCHINVGDDCITIKSGRDRQGRRIGRPSENITITNCTMLHGHGGVVHRQRDVRRRAPRRDLELRVSGDRARHPHQVDARPRRRRRRRARQQHRHARHQAGSDHAQQLLHGRAGRAGLGADAALPQHPHLRRHRARGPGRDAAGAARRRAWTTSR